MTDLQNVEISPVTLLKGDSTTGVLPAILKTLGKLTGVKSVFSGVFSGVSFQ